MSLLEYRFQELRIKCMVLEPFYFRGLSKPLFGVYHPAQRGTSRSVGVVLCPPMGQEYIRSHRSLLQLAKMLAQEGFDVLRFDYYGCGDSDGDCSQGSIRQWLEDISAAVDELIGGCNLERVCIVGLRMAGALGTMVAAERGDIDSIVLWDTVIKGKTYLHDLIRSHEEWLEGSFAKAQVYQSNQDSSEVMGFPLTDSLKKELTAINFLALKCKPADNMLIIESHRTAESGQLRECLKRVNVKPSYEYVPCPKAWIKHKNVDSRSLVPVPIIKRVVEWICEVHQ